MLVTKTDEVFERGMSQISALPSYRTVDPEELRRAHALNLDRAAQTIRSGQLPELEGLREAERLTIARAKSGLPIQDIIRGYRLSIGAIFEQFVAISGTIGLSHPDTIRGIALLWDLSDLFVRHATLAHQRFTMETAVNEARMRNDHVRAAFRGQATAAEMETWSGHAGGSLQAITATVDHADWDIEDARSRLGNAYASSGAHVVLGVIDDEIAGYIVDAWPLPVDGLTIAAGHPVAWDELPASYAAARALLRSARGLGGVATMENRGWRVVVDAVPSYADYLLTRYIEPLRQLGEFGNDLLATLRAYLACDRNVERCAVRLNLHANSLRHRLHRVSDSLDVDLNSSDVIVELAMALEIARRG